MSEENQVQEPEVPEVQESPTAMDQVEAVDQSPKEDEEAITLKDIKGAEQALSQILLAKVDFKLAYRIEKISRKLVSEIEKIENKRLDLISKFGEPEKDKDGKETGRQAVPPSKHKEFNDTFVAFLEQPAQITIEKLPYELLETSGIKVSSADILALKKFIAEPAQMSFIK